MTEPNIVGGLIGGALIGFAAVLLLALNGRITGVSGILSGLWTSNVSRERLWRVAFIFGLIAGAGLYALASGGLPLELEAGGPTLLIAGLLVGVGTRLGSGCISGHGVCGLARRSPRSLTATMIFMAVAALTVFLIHHGSNDSDCRCLRRRNHFRSRLGRVRNDQSRPGDRFSRRNRPMGSDPAPRYGRPPCRHHADFSANSPSVKAISGDAI
jgi:uncharacterized protein